MAVMGVREPLVVQGARLNVTCEYLDMDEFLCVLVDVKGEQPSYEEDCQCQGCRIDMLEMRYKTARLIDERLNPR